jgi:hypothetical protein
MRSLWGHFRVGLDLEIRIVGQVRVKSCVGCRRPRTIVGRVLCSLPMLRTYEE